MVHIEESSRESLIPSDANASAMYKTPIFGTCLSMEALLKIHNNSSIFLLVVLDMGVLPLCVIQSVDNVW